jgi:20S proteasome subunit beta 6
MKLSLRDDLPPPPHPSPFGRGPSGAPTRPFLVLLFLLLLLDPSLVPPARGQESSFDPYELNGGLVAAVAGKDFAIIASDTRMIGGGGYLLQSRSHLRNRLWSVEDDGWMSDVEDYLRTGPDNARPGQEEGDDGPDDQYGQPRSYRTQRQFRRRPPVMIGSAGCSTDCCQLQRTVRADYRAASYFGQVSTRASRPDQVATMLSQTLYNRRGFPYYAFCVVCGMDVPADDGRSYRGGGGKVYVYDAIGSYEQVAVAAAGTGRELMQPILDRLFAEAGPARPSGRPSPEHQPLHQRPRHVVEGTADEAVETLCHAYRSVSEREIGVGDSLVLHISEIDPSDGDVTCRVLVVPLKQH